MLSKLEGIREVQTYGEAIHLLVDSGRRRLPQVERALKRAHIHCRSIRVAPARMEEAFISMIRKLEV